MARYVFNGTVRDRKGYALSSATVTVYEADTTTAATIYDAKTGGSAISGAELTTDSGGRYTFYVDDGDYVSGDQFDITITKSGYSTQTLADEIIF
jgi:hypothetical protein